MHSLKMFLTFLLIILGIETSTMLELASESADIVLLMDSSDALGRRSFPSVKSFVNKIINNFPNKYRVALVQYSDDVHIEFQLDSFKAKNPMLNHIKKNLAFRGGSLRTGNAIQKVHETFFKTPSKDRSQILVVSTSGLSVDDVRRPAKLLQDEGIKVIALGTLATTQEELQAMATQSFHYYFDTPRDLVTFSQNMSVVIGAAIQADSIPVISTTAPPSIIETIPPKGCSNDSVADVVFVLDESVSNTGADATAKFLTNTINSLDVKEECINIGLVTFSTEPEVLSYLYKGRDKSDLLKAIQNFSPKQGKAHLGAALNFTRKTLFAEAYGSRKTQGVEQVAMVITHRPSDDSLPEAAALLQRTGVTVFAIGIEGANITQLTQVVSYPPERNVISRITFSNLPNQSEVFEKKLFNQIHHKLYVQAGKKVQLRTGCIDTEKADIYFLIDGSSSIHPKYFDDMKTFLKEVIKLFSVGPDQVRFGVVQYSNNDKKEFEIDEHTKSILLEKAINNIKQLGGDTYTGAAIHSMQPLFEKARKQRGSSVPCYLIVLTDGEAHDNVLVPARELRNTAVNIYAIGVKDANITQLYEIASSKSKVYFVQQFEALKEIKNELVRDICSEEACKPMKADIMFLVDSSRSIGPENFKKMKNFMKELVKKSDIGPDRVQIGVVQFSDIPKEEFPLHKHSTKSDIINAIGRMALMDQNTLTGAALNVISNYFKPTKGARPSVNKILILITDGEAQDEVATPATALREKGIIIYAVGVFNAYKPQLEEISGRTDKVFYVENFDILKQLENAIIFDICTIYEPDECKRIERLDVVFVIDSSGSIGEWNYEIMKNFMISIVNKSDVGPDKVQFGALKYSDNPENLFDLNTHGTKSAVIAAIQSDTPLNGNTYTARALQDSETLFTETRGSRKWKGVPQVLMVITDGDSHDTYALDGVSKSLRANAISIYAIGIKGANPAELLTMAGSKENMFYVDEFEGLKNISKTLSQQLCNISKPECEIQGEFVFLIDGSTRVSTEAFNRMKDFLKKLLDLIGYNSNIKVGMAQFSENYQEEFSLGNYQNSSELKDKIDNVSGMQGDKTYMGKALREVKSFFKSPKQRIARNIHQKLLLITDGKSDDNIAEPAKVLRDNGVEIHAIGVGKVNHMQLQLITNSPERKYTVANYNELSNVAKHVIEEMCQPVKSTCFVDVVLGFDITSQKSGDNFFSNQRLLKAYLPDILKRFTSSSSVSCNRGTNTQFSVAIPRENTDQSHLANLQVEHEKILKNLKDTVVNRPSLLNVQFLDTLWNAFQNISDNRNRSKVLLLFSDGLDDDTITLQHKSEEFRKQGLDGLITVALEGATNINELLHIEFGKGYGYNNQLTIGTHNIDSILLEYVDKIAERTCCCVHCKCVGEEGPRGQTAEMGSQGPTGFDGPRGHSGDDGEPGPRGLHGPMGQQGDRGNKGRKGEKGLRGMLGEKGENGIDGLDGIDGEEGTSGFPGLKGEKGDSGDAGSSGPSGLPGDQGQKGFPGDPGDSGEDNVVRGPVGLKGIKGRMGEKGPDGSAGREGSKGRNGAEGRRGPPGAPGQNGIPGPNGLQGEQGFHGPQGTTGITGVKGEKGQSGNKGSQGGFGVVGPKGNPGKPGLRGNKGETGDHGEKGERGSHGQRGMRGEEGPPGYGKPGIKGSKGEEGFPGSFGVQGIPGDKGIPGEPGQKGSRGRMGIPGLKGETGDPGIRGYPGYPGSKGAKGLPFFEPCDVIKYVREQSPCWIGRTQCPVYPTELVFALDLSQDTTPQSFEQMREIIIAIVNNTRIRESNCPVGARVAVVSYNSNTHYLIRFLDFQSKNQLIQEINTLSYQRSTSGRDLGGSMRFVARNVFKRTMSGANVRRVAVFFSNGQSDDPSSIDTAVLEFSALDIHPVVVAFRNTPHVNRAFAMDTTRLFQVINLQQERDYGPALERMQSCVLCYDKCDPDESCFRHETSPPQPYMDAAFILESSRRISPAEFKQLKGFLGAAIDNFDISAKPDTSLEGDRVAVVSHTPLNFRPQTHMHPAKIEFDFVAFRSKGRMKRHIQESLQPLNGSAAIGHAIQWTISNVFSVARNQRKSKAIFVISAGRTSQWDKGVLSDASLRAKCQGYAFFVLSLGREYDHTELEQLASFPLEQHLLQLGRNHKAELGYAVNFLKPFVHLLKANVNNYPEVHLKTRCAEINTRMPMYVPQYQIPISPEGSKTVSRGDEAVNMEYLLSDSSPPGHVVSNA
ncbi:collagen alpha-6(VI) chain-like isoform X2 [Varanus komodoensis]|nr:collagen alpha-6(VI) chain-like isoform X2 [Varanus komodoensis]XP_044311652.1 collagen alpha-6(VI) chain-like isoform X2 [Varanus komodoensis]